jgi:hypothetical protein
MTVIWGLALLPMALIMTGMRTSNHGGVSRAQDECVEGLQFARGLAILSSACPILRLLMDPLPERAMRSLGPELVIFLPVVGGLAGLFAVILYLVTARGIERWAGTLASLMAMGLLVLSVVAGWSAACC